MILQLGLKELRSLWHDKVLLFFAIWAFSFGIYSAATAVSRELHHAAIAVVDEDRSALSQRVREGALKVVEGFPLLAPKTKALKVVLDKLGVGGKAVIVDHEPTDALVLSGRNIPGLRVVNDSHLTAYDVLDCRTLVVTQEALSKLEERLTP